MKSFSPPKKEEIILSYAVHISSGRNLSKTSYLSPTTIDLYLRAAADYAITAHLRDPRYRYTNDGHRISSSYFPALQQWISYLKKWDGPTEKAWALTLPILSTLRTFHSQSSSTSVTSAVVDAIILGCHTGSRSCEYCRGSPSPGDNFARVPRIVIHANGPVNPSLSSRRT